MHDKEDTEVILEEMENQKDQYPDATLDVSAASFMMGSGGTNITIDVIGKNTTDLEKVANTIKDKIKDIESVEEVTSNQDEKKNVYSLTVDPSKGNPEQVAQQLGVMLNQTPIGTVSLNDKQTPVILEPILDTKTPKDLENIPVMTETGMVPVSTIAKLESEERSTSQFHKDGETFLQVTAYVDLQNYLKSIRWLGNGHSPDFDCHSLYL